ncbi:hypothetical protein EDB85DRAFT_2086004 [Lactarius pseudohatsudake]|nr:hypothetical protein EDB85DRAFT_2086004 [Lactarius pseudohatsudake]
MSYSTPEVYLVWSILSFLARPLLLPPPLCAFVVYHLWAFDRFHCLRWNQGNDGGFKRLMTYNYILGVPFWVTYSVGFCVIKYSEGYVFLPEVGVIPKPYQLWSQSHQNAVFPLYLCVSVAWGMEMVTHLESLCFLIFLLNAGSGAQDWFRSRCFRTWAVGSFISLLYLPLITIFTRSSLESEAYIFLAGTSWSLLMSICSIIVMSRFKPFLDTLKREGVDMTLIVRLTKFHELNAIYICSRTLSAIPLLLHSADGLRSHHQINVSLFVMGLSKVLFGCWDALFTVFSSDLLQVISGFGFAITGAMALPIFFPRSIEGEIMRSSGLRSVNYGIRNHLMFISREREVQDMYDLEQQPDQEVDKTSITSSSYIGSILQVVPGSFTPREGDWPGALKSSSASFRLEPNRRQPDADELSTDCLSVQHLSNRRLSRLSRFLNNFKSPIGINLFIAEFTLHGLIVVCSGIPDGLARPGPSQK